MSHPAFIKIKLTFLDQFNFGQKSTAKTKSYIQLPFEFLDSNAIKMLPPSLFHGLIMLLKRALSVSSDTLYCSRSDLSLSRKCSLSDALTSLSKLELIEIIDDAPLVYKRKEEKIREDKRRIASPKSEIAVTPKKATPDSPHGEIGKQASELIGRYCELWKAKYKTNVSVSGKWAGNAKTLVKDHGLKRSVELVEAFMEINDTWFIQNRHSFDLILTKLAQINHFAGTGVQITQTQLRQADQAQANKSAAEIAISIIKNRVTQ